MLTLMLLHRLRLHMTSISVVSQCLNHADRSQVGDSFHRKVLGGSWHTHAVIDTPAWSLLWSDWNDPLQPHVLGFVMLAVAALGVLALVVRHVRRQASV